MRILKLACVTLLAASLTGCELLGAPACTPWCNASQHSSSSLVEFLYPNGQVPPRDNSIPELHVPLRVGLAFLPGRGATAAAPDAAQRAQLLERIRAHFSGRKFVSEIVVIPDYYFASQRGFAGLEALQRLYSVDLLALVSYDQVTHQDENGWSLGYLTIVGAYVLKGSRHDVSTLVDLAVIDPATRSLVLRAGGIDSRHGNTTMIEESRESRAAAAQGFDAAAGEMITHFDTALSAFEEQVRNGKANVRVVHKSDGAGAGAGAGGGGALSLGWLAVLAGLLAARSAAGAARVRRALARHDRA